MTSAARITRSSSTAGRTVGPDPPSGNRCVPCLVDIATIAENLGVSVRHIRRLVAERRIPYVKWGNLLRFDPVAVADWISCKAVGPAVPDVPVNADTHDAGPLERTDGRCN